VGGTGVPVGVRLRVKVIVGVRVTVADGVDVGVRVGVGGVPVAVEVRVGEGPDGVGVVVEERVGVGVVVAESGVVVREGLVGVADGRTVGVPGRLVGVDEAIGPDVGVRMTGEVGSLKQPTAATASASNDGSVPRRPVPHRSSICALRPTIRIVQASFEPGSRSADRLACRRSLSDPGNRTAGSGLGAEARAGRVAPGETAIRIPLGSPDPAGRWSTRRFVPGC
jgi:hypothetical protein